MEKFESVLVRAIQKIEEIPHNLRFMRLDAKDILEYIDVK